MSDRSSAKTTLALAAAGGALVLSLAAHSPARAGDDGQGTIMGSVMRLVGIGPDADSAAPPIDYRERGPLVLPKSTDLPPPLPRAEARSPAWPKDPDIMRARKAAALAREPAKRPGQDTQMDREEMMRDRDVRQAARAQTQDCERFPETCDPHKIWSALRIKKGDPGAIPNDQAALAPGQEPERKYLTQPPPGYMVTTRDVKPTIEMPRERDRYDNPNVYYSDVAKKRHSVE